MNRRDTLPPFWWSIITICALASALFLASPRANAETRFGVHVGSQHFGKNADAFNNFNPGVYVYHNGWTAGTYYNSERRQSAYAGYTFEWHLGGRWTAAATVGAITGYSTAPVLPMVVPSLSGRITEDVSLRVAFVPAVSKHGASALHLSIERKF